MGTAARYQNESFEPVIVRVDSKLYIVIQRKFYDSDTLCLDLRKWIVTERYRSTNTINLAGGEVLVPTGKGLFIDYETFRFRIMPQLRELFPDDK